MQKDKKSKKSIARQQRIKDMALELFLINGYENTNISDIIKKSGGSFSDIYNDFKNKQNLFNNIVIDALKDNYKEIVKNLDYELDLRDFLYNFSYNFINCFKNKKNYLLVKIILSQLYDNKHLVEYFKQNIDKDPISILIKYFKKCQAPLCEYAEKYANIFFTMIRGKIFENIIFNTEITDIEEKEQYISFMVDFFVNSIKNN